MVLSLIYHTWWFLTNGGKKKSLACAYPTYLLSFIFNVLNFTLTTKICAWSNWYY